MSRYPGLPIYGDDKRWQDHAVCATTDPDAFYPPNGDDYAVPRRVCLGCPVRLECLLDGLNEEHGMWGGTTPDERHQLRKKITSNPKHRAALISRAARIHQP